MPSIALDVTIQAQIMDLVKHLRGEIGMAVVWITHDLSVVWHISDRIAVMYLGKIVELTTRKELYDNLLHPYTKALLSTVTIPDPLVEKKRQRIILEEDVPSPASPPEGCNFNTRCPIVTETCFKEDPERRDVGAGHFCLPHGLRGVHCSSIAGG